MTARHRGERGIALVLSLTFADAEKLLVDDAMSQAPYAVPPDAPLDEVSREMAAKRYGSDLLHTRLAR